MFGYLRLFLDHCRFDFAEPFSFGPFRASCPSVAAAKRKHEQNLFRILAQGMDLTRGKYTLDIQYLPDVSPSIPALHSGFYRGSA